MKPTLLIFAVSLIIRAATPATTLTSLPNSTVNAVTTDAVGNIYVAGYQGTSTAFHAFVAKLSPAGLTLYSTTFAGSKTDSAAALAVDSTGAAYILGQTTSLDFPVTAGALQTTLQAPHQQGFAAKVDANGKVVYSTFVGGSSDIYPGPHAIVVDSAGDAILSGETIGGVFPITPNAPFVSSDNGTFFIVKIDPAGANLLAAIRGVGGSILTLDGLGSIYITGTQLNDPTSIPITPGAFQSTYQVNVCGGDAQLEIACTYQYVTKLNASLTQIVYSTYLNGSYGASPVAISVDAQGNAFIAGTTNSPDYPTTPDAYEPSYVANAPSPPQTCLFICIFPPPASGYLTKLNSTGTALIYSTYFSGTQADTISFAAFTANGIYLSGTAQSPDLPGFEGFPALCLPQTYATLLSADATEVGASHPAPGNILAYDASSGTLLAALTQGTTGTDLVAFDSAAPPSAIACILDSADLKPVTSVAPGELLTIFGERLFSGVISQPPGQFATSLDGVSVAIDGIPSPLLYVGPQQINFQAPFEIAGGAQADIAFASTQLNLSDSITLPIVAINPAAFLETLKLPLSLSTCPLKGYEYSGGALPLAFNADGSPNTCMNPAAPGSVVTIFLNGLGVTSPVPITGAITPSPGVPLNLPITLFDGNQSPVSASSAPGSISGVWQVDIRMSANETGAVPVGLSVGGVPLRDGILTIWVQ
jgi:uncharacterized protein (TIGR03437 family)